LANEGVGVFVNGRTNERVRLAVENLKKETGNTNITGVAADFSDKQQVDQLIAQIPEVDILINNVGIFEPKEFRDIADEDWFKFYEVNVLSGVRLSRAYFDKMINKNWGRIMNGGLFYTQTMTSFSLPTVLLAEIKKLESVKTPANTED